MEYQSTCEECGKDFSWKKLHGKYTRKYCSTKCSYQVLSKRNENQFRWDSLTGQEKLERLRKNFEARVVKCEGCWKWTAGKDKDGYGQMQTATGNKLTKAHRISWMVNRGPIPKDLKVCHTCDNPECTNPEHLFLGTTKDNGQDMARKGRSTKGRITGLLPQTTKLTEEIVREMRNLLDIGVKGSILARKYSVTTSCICSIRKRKTWKHVTPEIKR